LPHIAVVVLRHQVAFAFAILSELLDYAAAGSLPVIGDIVEAITVQMLYALIGQFSLFWRNRIHPDAHLYLAVAFARRRELKKSKGELDGRKRTSTPL
jgi:hypothetical protein